MVPIINTTQSVLGFLQGETFSFQPVALNAPTHWSASTLPAGVTIDDTTGLISGVANNPGVYNVAVFASNGDGISAPVIFTFGIEFSSFDPSLNVVEAQIDLATRLVTCPQVTTPGAPLWTLKHGDGIIFLVQFLRGGVPVDLTLTALDLSLKEFDGDPCEIVSTAFAPHSGAFFVYLKLSSPALDASLSNYQSDSGTSFLSLWEFEWIADNSFLFEGFPATLRGASQTFTATIFADQATLSA